jgi:hypothetical protein
MSATHADVVVADAYLKVLLLLRDGSTWCRLTFHLLPSPIE